MAATKASSSTAIDEERYARKRALVLLGVHVVAGLHIAHWKLAGRTLAPLEFNEAVYTFALGVVTAGFLLLAAAVVATAIFGRYFCSWACHILALQDASHWLLRKLGVKPRPLRSRALRAVGVLAMLYMFVAPLLMHLVAEQRLPPLHFASDSVGWGSLMTSEFWRNLPGPWIIALTFVACGPLAVYVLGSRSFCTTVCPYGALFALADRIAPGRLVARGDCSGCGRCTAVCTSHIRVHQELTKFGAIVDRDCLRDLDCMAACPDGNIVFRFSTPPLFRGALARRGLPRKFDVTPAEELLVAAVVLATFFATRGLYDSVPFLVAITLGVFAGALAWMFSRVLRRRDARLQKIVLAQGGRVRPAGVAFCGVSVLLATLTAHSGWIRWNEFAVERAIAEVDQRGTLLDPERLAAAHESAETVRTFGLLESPAARLRHARIAELCGELEEAEGTLAELLTQAPKLREAVLPLARVRIARGELSLAAEQLDSALAETPPPEPGRRDQAEHTAELHLRRGELWLRLGDPAAAAEHFTAARSLRPDWALVHYELGVTCVARDDWAGAGECFQRACELAPGEAEFRNNLGFVLLHEGRPAEAEAHLRAAVELAPRHAIARFNLGQALLALGRGPEGRGQLEAATDLDPGLAGAVGELLRSDR